MIEFLKISKNQKASWKDELGYNSTKECLNLCADELEKSELVIRAVEKDNVPFGIGLDFDDVQEWLFLNKGMWCSVHWERGSFEKSATFATPVLSDACNFFAASNGYWGGLFNIIYSRANAHQYVFADCYGFDHSSGKMTLDVTSALKNMAQLLWDDDMPVAVSPLDALESSHLRLYEMGGAFCLENKLQNQRCWFVDLGLALKCFILILKDKFVVQPDAASLFCRGT